MKKHLLMASALGLALQVATATRAVAAPPETAEKTEGRQRGGPGARMDTMAERLKLSPDQRKTVGAALKERMDRMNVLQGEFTSKRKAVFDASDKKIDGALNPDQKAEFAKMKGEMEKRRDEFKSHRRDRKE